MKWPKKLLQQRKRKRLRESRVQFRQKERRRQFALLRTRQSVLRRFGCRRRLGGRVVRLDSRQMEHFCIDEGKTSLDSWEDCYKMMKRQGIVKNYMEYSGLCHELLLNDECELLLPTTAPPEYYEWKRKAKREHK